MLVQARGGNLAVSASPTFSSSQFTSELRSTQRRFMAAAAARVPMSIHEPTTNMPYDTMAKKLAVVRQYIKTPLTLAEKIIYSHLDDPADAQSIVRGKSYLKLRPGT